jgi:hypothetical protein
MPRADNGDSKKKKKMVRVAMPKIKPVKMESATRKPKGQIPVPKSAGKPKKFSFA